ncbi:MAG: type VI secretion system contractile sheath large subunit [Planctomycetaceae bacterium]
MRVSTTFGDTDPAPRRQVTPSTPLQILVLGDFGATTPSKRPTFVDRDNLDEVFQQFGVQLLLSLDQSAPESTISFSELDDFHPDQLFNQLQLFASLRTSRRRLQNSKTFEEEANAIFSGPAEDDTTKSSNEPEKNVPAGNASLLDAAIERTEDERKPVVQQIAEGQLSIDDYVRKLVEPFVTAKPDPRQAEFVDSIDEAIAEAMRRLLHHPQFQQLESAWLGLKMLTRRLETDASLKIAVVSISKEQLAEQAADAENSSVLQCLLRSQDSDSDPWSIVLGDYVFDNSADDINMLGHLASVTAASGSVFLAAASPDIFGCTEMAQCDFDSLSPPDAATLERWNELRALPEAANVSLLIPRLLARMPYGKRSSPIDSFGFEEIPDGQPHGDYLWMNAAFGATALLGEAFSKSGWDITESFTHQIEGLPIFVFKDGTESVIKPCAELELGLSAGGKIAEYGLSVVYSIRDSGSVRIPAIRSLSSANDAMNCRWR